MEPTDFTMRCWVEWVSRGQQVDRSCRTEDSHMTDPTAIRWESLSTIAAAFALAVWVVGDFDSAKPPRDESNVLVLRFKVQLKNQPGRTVELLDGARLGRAGSCEVILDDPTVSKHHAKVRYDGRAWVEDTNSTNGTFVNGRRAETPLPLARGDRIALGTAKIVFLGLASRGSNS